MYGSANSLAFLGSIKSQDGIDIGFRATATSCGFHNAEMLIARIAII
jgi:hypothetical protein